MIYSVVNCAVLRLIECIEFWMVWFMLVWIILRLSVHGLWLDCVYRALNWCIKELDGMLSFAKRVAGG